MTQLTMRMLLLCIASIAVPALSPAQPSSSSNPATEKYDRNSLSILLLKTPRDADMPLINRALSEIKPGDKYFHNELGSLMFSADVQRIHRQSKGLDILGNSNKDKTRTNSSSFRQQMEQLGIFKPRDEKNVNNSTGASSPNLSFSYKFAGKDDWFGNAVGRELTEQNIGAQIMAIWSRQDEEGQFEELLKRIDVNLTGEKIRRNEDKYIIDNFKKLFFRNFVLVFDFKEIIDFGEYYRRLEKQGQPIPRGYVGYVDVYAYRLSIDDPLFEGHVKPYFDQPARLASHSYPFEFLGYFSAVVPVEQTFYQDSKGNTHYNPKDDEGIFENMVQKAYGDAIFAFEKIGYGVKSSLVDTKPLKVEIGKKEGVYPDQRFFVYEYRQTGDDQLNYRRIGVIRANKVADNRQSLTDENGELKATTFYQVHGRKLMEGMSLEEKNDLGFAVSAGWGGSVGGTNEFNRLILRLDINTARILSVPGLNIYAEVESGGKNPVNGFVEESNNTFFGFGLNKRLNLTRWIDLMPFAGYHVRTATQTNTGNIAFGKAGLAAPITLWHNLFLEPSAGLVINARGAYPTKTPFNAALKFTF